MDSAVVEFREHWHYDWESWTIKFIHMHSSSHTEAKRHKIKERERPYQELYFKGMQGCRKTFCFIYNIENKNVLSIAWTLDRDGLSPGVHAITGKLPKYAIQYEDTKRIKTFFWNMLLTMLCLSQRPPNYKTTKYYYCLLIKALLTYIKNINLLLLKCITEVLVWELSRVISKYCYH